MCNVMAFLRGIGIDKLFSRLCIILPHEKRYAIAVLEIHWLTCLGTVVYN